MSTAKPPNQPLQPRFVARSGVIARDVGGEVFALTDDGQVHRLLNPAARVIWHCLVDAGSGGMRGADCVDALTQRFQVTQASAAQDAADFLDLLVARGLAAVAPSPIGPATVRGEH